MDRRIGVESKTPSGDDETSICVYYNGTYWLFHVRLSFYLRNIDYNKLFLRKAFCIKKIQILNENYFYEKNVFVERLKRLI